MAKKARTKKPTEAAGPIFDPNRVLASGNWPTIISDGQGRLWLLDPMEGSWKRIKPAKK